MRIGTPGFIAARLTQAREARGFTQTLLSELTGIKPQSISHYEQGRQSPSPDALDFLCTALQIPLRFFLNPDPGYSTANIFFRSQRIEGRLTRLRDTQRLGWLKEIRQCVHRYVDLPEVRVPSAPVGDAEAGAEGDADAAACEVRRVLRAGSGPVRDLLQALEALGCVVSIGPSFPPADGTFSQWDNGVPWVFLNSADPRASWFRYRAAHELGHLVMHSRLSADATSHRELEAEADKFARAFLLPRKAFGDDVWAPTIDALLTIKKDWNCPVAVMIARCGEIGRFDAGQVKRAMVNLTRRGWSVGEPREAPVEFERPPLLARSIQRLVEEGCTDAYSLLGELALNAADVEDLTGLRKGFFASQSEQLRVQSPDVVIAQI